MTKPIFPPHEVQRTGRDEKSNNPLTELNECSYPPYCISLFYLQIKPFYTDIFYLRKPLELSPKTMELTPKLMEITPKACGDKTSRKKNLNHTAGKG